MDDDYKIKATKGHEDWCWPAIACQVRIPFGEEVTLVVVFPDCKLFIGVDAHGIICGWAKVVNGKTVWVKCSNVVPKFKERFYDSFI
jgi:hypothetical protein